MAKKPAIIEPASKSRHIFLALHGDSGIGKSRLAGTSPGKVLIIRPATSHLNSLNADDFARVEQAKVADWDDMLELQTYLRADGEEYDWVWVDELSALFHTLLDDVWSDALKRKPERAEFDLDKGEFGINMNRLTRWLRHAAVGPDKFNFGYTAWSVVGPSPDQDDDGDPIEKLMPWIQGKGMPNMCAGYMNVVAYYHKAKIGGEEDVRVLRTESSPRYYAKDQWGAFGGRLVRPTMPKLIEKVEGSPKFQAAQDPKKSTKTTGQAKPRRRVIKRG